MTTRIQSGLKLRKTKEGRWEVIEYRIIVEGEGLKAAYDDPAGYDLPITGYEHEKFTEELRYFKLRTGIKLQMPKGVFATIKPRSSAVKKGFIVIEGTIDGDYTGELIVQALANKKGTARLITEQDFTSIAQIKFSKKENIKLIPGVVTKKTKRGANGFGSSDEQ